MDNYYFTYWIARYGKDNIEKLCKKVCRKITVPLEIKKEVRYR